MLLFIVLFTLFFSIIDCKKNENILNRDSEADCYERIFRGCSYDTNFSYEEIENVRHYIQKRFLKETLYKPVKPPCSQLYVRKDFKCLTHEEKIAVVNVFKELYNSGVMERYSAIHARYWAEIHKSNEGALWHRWFANEFEKEMRKINSNISLPYWEMSTDFAAPEKSIIWDYFGHAGHRNNNYCVTDGPFGSQLIYRNRTKCLKRQWNKDQTLGHFSPPEWETAVNQLTTSFLLGNMLLMNSHFKTHLSIGGYEGDMSVDVAPNDPLFYLFHGYQVDLLLFKIQFNSNQQLIPESYNFGFKIDPKTNKVFRPNLKTDFLIYFNNTSIIETFQVGFGDLCFIHDQLIKPINRLIKNEKIETPTAFNRLPKQLLEKYYPNFYSGNFSFLNYGLPEVGNCNQNSFRKRCKPMPVMPPFLSTANGRRQMLKFLLDSKVDTSGAAIFSEALYYEFMSDMYKVGYCSPYV